MKKQKNDSKVDEYGFRRRTTAVLKKRGVQIPDGIPLVLPKRYKDYRNITPTEQIKDSEEYALLGTLMYVNDKTSGGRRFLSVRILLEGTDKKNPTWLSVFYFGAVDYWFRILAPMKKQWVVVCGKVAVDPKWGCSMTSPDEITQASHFHPGLRPVYKKFSGISEPMWNQTLSTALTLVHEPFEWELMQKMQALGFVDYASALHLCHHPNTPEEIEKGRRRIRFNDLLYLAIGLQKNQNGAEQGICLHNTKEYQEFESSLPFPLTKDQEIVLNVMQKETDAGKRLNALVQGDVGSGKTIVAIAMMMYAKACGVQCVMMAPREVLAQQHYQTVIHTNGITEEDVVFLHSGMKAAQRRKALKQIQDGSVSFVIGTHSCISEDVRYKNLGLIVTDEEHLFGVLQKEALQKKAEAGAHIISMTATPIPRTLATALYGDQKEILSIRTKPAGRLPIQTAVVHKRSAAKRFMLQQIHAGHQAYIVCPAIEESENLVSIESVEEEYRTFFDQEGITMAVVNGKMDRKESDEQVRSFKDGDAKVLLSTTVIEVGVDVPNATVITIEQAERFGLASLHQLRGRVGRGSAQSYCMLRSDEMNNARLNVLCRTNDGFQIAEEDMELRGTGNLLGTEQSGLNRFVQEMLEDPDLYQLAKETANWCIRNRFGKGLMELYKRIYPD